MQELSSQALLYKITQRSCNVIRALSAAAEQPGSALSLEVCSSMHVYSRRLKVYQVSYLSELLTVCHLQELSSQALHSP